MADFVLELKGEHFKRGYLLYVVEIKHGSDSFYYVGQTGDRNYLTARPAFRRISGHFEDRIKSTQNQIYKYIAENLIGAGKNHEQYSEDIKQKVETFLTNSRVIMYVYRVIDFQPDIEMNVHKSNVQKVENLERNVIRDFISSGKIMMNKARIHSEAPCPFPNILAEIKADFSLD